MGSDITEMNWTSWTWNLDQTQPRNLGQQMFLSGKISGSDCAVFVGSVMKISKGSVMKICHSDITEMNRTSWIWKKEEKKKRKKKSYWSHKWTEKAQNFVTWYATSAQHTCIRKNIFPYIPLKHELSNAKKEVLRRWEVLFPLHVALSSFICVWRD